jgi:hypothetical protein
MVLRQALPRAPGPLNQDALVWALLVALVVFVVTSRLEHRLARHVTYRIPRHILGLGMFGLAACMLLLRYSGRVILLPGRLPDLARLCRALDDRVQIGVMLGVIVAMHFLLWTDNRILRAWDGVLEVLTKPNGRM